VSVTRYLLSGIASHPPAGLGDQTLPDLKISINWYGSDQGDTFASDYCVQPTETKRLVPIRSCIECYLALAY
jgi:hypothetical protein